jgi:hypothetical protein
MNIRSLVPFAIACFALWAPRIMTSGNAFGGGVVGPKPLCDKAHLAHPCSGPVGCPTLTTTVESNNTALILYVEGDTVVNCVDRDSNCSGKAKLGDSDCDPPT